MCEVFVGLVVCSEQGSVAGKAVLKACCAKCVGILRHLAEFTCRACASLLVRHSVGCARKQALTLCENGFSAMKFSSCYTFVCWALAGFMLSQPTAAMTLGRLRGASVLGQPLALTIPLQIATDEDVSGLCVGADVYFGESLVEDSSVTTRLEAGAAAFIRVSVRKPVDEPIVTLYLKTGCQQQSMRKYVLLSEFSSEVQPTQRTAVQDVVVDKPAVRTDTPRVVAAVPVVPLQPATSAIKRQAGAHPSAETAVSSPQSAPAASGAAKVVGAPVPPKLNATKKKVGTGGARLQLLPLDLAQDWEPSLRWTDQLPAPLGEVDAQKREQAAQLWRAISASPEEILQEAGKRTAMEAELRNLVASSRANQVAITELNAQIQAAHAERFRNPAVYVLLALLAACGAGLAYVISGRPGGAAVRSPWWKGAGNGADSAATHWQNTPERAGHQAVEPHAVNDAERPAGSAFSAAIDIPLSDSVLPSLAGAQGARASSGEVIQQRSSSNTKPTDFLHSNLGALRAINTQEMVDARQQADFFVALGQHDEAVGVLYGALSHNAESNPHIYLDLIALLHKLSRKDDYEKVRQVFNVLYTCHIPAYGEYSNVGRSLLEYPDLLSPLVSLWPKPLAIDYAVRCLLRDGNDSADQGIDREAFEDLLLLHGILGNVAPPCVLSEAVQPCPTRTLPALSAASQPFLAARSYSSLDVDLSGEH